VVGEGRSLSLLIQGAPMDGAARLQAATRGLGVRLLISEAAAQAAAQAADAAGLVPVGEGDERLWRPA
jgi:hypothetical protein